MLTKEILLREYVVNKKSTAQIASEHGTSSGNVSYHLRRHRIPTRPQSRLRDLAGQQIGKLTVLKFISSTDTGTYWRCQCECGRTLICERRELVRKDSRRRQSCGCRGYIGVVPGFFWSHFLAATRRRKGERFATVEIDYEFVCSLFEAQGGKCALTGMKLTFGQDKASQWSGTTASLDRKDSKLGYVPGNVQFVHKIVNVMKNKLTDAEFIEWCDAVSKHARESA